MKKERLYSDPQSTGGSIRSTTAIVDLENEYRLTRAALVNAGVDMSDSMDALYRDWRRWREKPPKSLALIDRVQMAGVDRWWAQHLAQFRSLVDPPHVAARAERAHKDRSAVRTKRHSGSKRQFNQQ